jgi:hypothetical protein
MFAVFSPDSITRIAWDIVGIFVLMVDLIWIPMQVFEPYDTIGISLLSWSTLLYWTIDILLAFNTGFYADTGQLVMRRFDIVKTYIRTWFFFDVMLIAFDWSAIFRRLLGSSNTQAAEESAGAARAGKLARIARVIRLLRLMRMAKLRKLLFRIQDLIDSEWLSVVFAVGRNMGVILLMNHYLACAWFLCGKQAGQAGWVERLHVVNEDYSIQYLESLGWSLAQFTPGASRIYPEAASERIFHSCVSAVSLMVATCFVGSITATMGSVWAANRYTNTQVFLLKRFLGQSGIARELSTRITRYIECVIEDRQRVVPIGKVEYLKLLSGPLRVELLTMIFTPYLRAHTFFVQFHEASRTAMRQLCSTAVHTEHYAKNDSVYVRGTVAKQMYFVQKGKLGYRFLDSEKSKRTVLLVAKHWCSEHALWIPWRHRGQMKGVSDCELICLQNGKFWDIISKSHSAGLLPLARNGAMYFASYVRAVSSFGAGYLTDVPPSDMALLLSESHRTQSGRISFNEGEVRRAEKLEIDLVGFSDSDSEDLDNLDIL